MTQEITQKTCWSAPRSLGGAKHYFPPPLTPACQRLQFNLRRNIFQIKCPVQSTVSALQWYYTQRRPIWIRVIFVLPSVFASKLCWPLCVVRVMQPHQRLSFMHHIGICIIWEAVKEKADATTSEMPHLVGEMPHQVGASLGSLFCGRLAHWAHFRPEGYQQERKFWKVARGN